MARKRATKALTHKTNWGLNDTVLPEDFNRIEGNIKQNEANQNTANSNHTTLAARVSKTESDISKNKTDISTANSNHTALANRVTTAEGNINKNKSDIATANSNHTALASRVTTAENNINTANSNHTALATRVSKTESDISKNKADIATANNNHTALANRVTTAEGNINNLNTKVNKLNLGVRNLAKNTNIEITSGRRTDMPIAEDEIKKLIGEEITVSVDIDIVSAVSSTNNGRVGAEFSITYSDNSIQYIGAWEFFTTTSKTVKKRIATTHRIKNMDIKTISLLGIYIQNITSGNTKIGFPKVGKGNMITDWTPAVEDIQDQITNNKNDIATTNSNYIVLAGRVTTAESNITKNKNDIAAANTNHTALAGRVTTAEGNINKNKTDIATANTNHTALAGRVTTAEGNINKNKTDIATANTNHSNLVKEYNKTKEQANNWDSFKKNGGDITGDLKVKNSFMEIEGEFKGWSITNPNATSAIKNWYTYVKQNGILSFNTPGQEQFYMTPTSLEPALSSPKSLGTASNPFTNIFFSKLSTNTNGYIPLGNGLILQFGYSNTITESSWQIINFPIAFPNGVISINASGYWDNNNPGWVTTMTQLNNNQSFKICAKNTGSAISCAYWFAIGY